MCTFSQVQAGFATEGTPNGYEDDSSDGLKFNRRNFLRTTGVVGLAETIAAPAELAAQSTPAAVGPGDVPVRLNVNGRQIDLMIEPRTTLLDALSVRMSATASAAAANSEALRSLQRPHSPVLSICELYLLSPQLFSKISLSNRHFRLLNPNHRKVKRKCQS